MQGNYKTIIQNCTALPTCSLQGNMHLVVRSIHLKTIVCGGVVLDCYGIDVILWRNSRKERCGVNQYGWSSIGPRRLYLYTQSLHIMWMMVNHIWLWRTRKTPCMWGVQYLSHRQQIHLHIHETWPSDINTPAPTHTPQSVTHTHSHWSGRQK